MGIFQNTMHHATLKNGENHWHLEIPPGKASEYRLAQLDDYSGHRRSEFYWNAPTTLALHARVSDSTIPGTWGFGLWNDPFSLVLGLGGMTQIFPVLPNAAWFFFASPENYLSFRNDMPPSGFLAATFHAPLKSPVLLVPQLALFPLLIFRSWAKMIRTKLGKIIGEDSIQLNVEVTQWNEYKLNWTADKVEFLVNGETIFVSRTSPVGPLGLVIWIDNQYAAFKPSGEIKTGALKTSSPAWLEIEGLAIRTVG